MWGSIAFFAICDAARRVANNKLDEGFVPKVLLQNDGTQH